jgi:preprotein translocase subunit SecE
MGRLLRKKTVKKKKPNEAGVSSSSVSPDADISQPAVSGPESTRKKQPQQQSRKVPVPVKNGYVEKTMQYLREVRAELRKVTWPSRKQTVGTTAVVIVLVMIISVFLGLVDMSLSGLIRLIFQ